MPSETVDFLSSIKSLFLLSVCSFFVRYQFVRLDGSMSIKKRGKIVDSFNNPEVFYFEMPSDSDSI